MHVGILGSGLMRKARNDLRMLIADPTLHAIAS